MELKEAVEILVAFKLANIIEMITQEEFEDVKTAIDTVLEELNNRIPISKLELLKEKLIKDGNYLTPDNPNGRVHFLKEDVDYKIELINELLNEE